MLVKQKLLALIAFRNVALHRLKSLTIGMLLAMGTVLLCIGLTLLVSVEKSMESSITQSLAGHFQLYSKQAKDDLALFGGGFMSREEIGTIPNFQPVKEEVLALEEVKGVMPMGIDMSLIPKGNTFDELFDELRSVFKEKNQIEINETIEKIKFQITQLRLELEAGKRIDSSGGNVEAQLQTVAATENLDFWQNFSSVSNDEFEKKLSFLETKIAPLAGEKQPLYMRFVGIQPENYSNLFPKFKVLRGTEIPKGQRGMLLSHKLNEDFFKNMAARTFDKIHKKVTKSGLTIATDDEAKRFAADLPKQYLQILLYLSSQETKELLPKFKEILGSSFPSSEKTADVLKEFLKTDDSNFLKRYDFFYQEIAPKIVVYPIQPGQTVIMRTYTRSGYVKTLPVKVFGVFTFEGLENSDLSGGFSLVDLVTFRDLYGAADESSLAENSELSKELGSLSMVSENTELSSANAAEALFGGNVESKTEKSIPLKENNEKNTQLSNSQLSMLKPLAIKPLISSSYNEEVLQKGLALNLAVIAKPNANRKILSDKLSKIAEKYSLKLADWKEASGIVGQFVTIVRAVLMVGVGVIVLVALLIINNSLVVSTLDRIKEIGTMRALGSQKAFIKQLFLWETGMIAFFGTLFGLVISILILSFMSTKGIPAQHPVVEFLFSGPRLFPKMSFSILFFVPVFVTGLSVLSSLYAASYASRITPSEAMQERE
jgi:ABC-type lipoprotein release transport system permease subunit